jgi:hypothetical protein
MATFTDNYDLKKPDQSEYYNVDDFNGNMDILDTVLYQQERKIDALEGVGGAVPHQDLGADPTQAELCQAFCEGVWGSGTFTVATPLSSSTYITTAGDTHTAVEIWNGTWMRNDYDNHRWVLSNTTDTDPVVYEYIDVGVDTVSQADAETFGVAKASSTTPLVAGTADVGTDDGTYARGNHVHPAQTTVTGNAGSATKLATSRTIDGVSFDGTAAITHYGTCSTAAATAAKTVSLPGFKLVVGAKLAVKFTVTNTAPNPTLSAENTAAAPMRWRGSAVAADILSAGRVYEFVYDGSAYEIVGDAYSAATATTPGIVTLSDTYNTELSGAGIAASQQGLARAYEALKSRTNININRLTITGDGSDHYEITLAQVPSANNAAIGGIVGGSGIGSVNGLRRLRNIGATVIVEFINALPTGENIDMSIYFPVPR